MENNTNKIQNVFQNKNKVNIGYIVAGYPTVDFTKQFLKHLNDMSIDILEIGIPYSDPIADGKTISNAAFQACQNGVNTDTVFDILVSEKQNVSKPLVLLVYYNLIFSYGEDEFIQKCIQSNISGIIIPDLPYEESQEFSQKLRSNKISFIPLVSVTSDNRIEKLVKDSDGFIYAIGSLGVTGTKPVSLERLADFVKSIKKYTNTPISLGFGIKTNDDVNTLRKYADGIIIGTSIVSMTESNNINLVIKNINNLYK